jgi:hypothetical protein
MALVQECLLPGAKIVVGSWGALPALNLLKVAFVYGSLGSFEFLFDQVEVVVTTQGKQSKVPMGWQLSKTQATHLSIGGVTDGIDNCYLESVVVFFPLPSWCPTRKLLLHQNVVFATSIV